MSFVLFLIAFVGFLYLVSRINSLESKIRKLEKGGIVERSAIPIPTPSQPIAHHVIPTPPVVQNQPEHNFEFKIGGKFFTVVGAIAVLFGVGFFLRYAFEQNLITETMRVVLGVIAGIAVIGIGEYLKNKFQYYSQILQGTGIGILYLTFYAAYSFYSLLGQPAAFVVMIAITLSAVYLAVRANSQAMAGAALFGAYITPFLIGLPAGDPHKLFIYIALVNIGVLLLALWKSWRNITLGSLLGSALVYVGWHAESYNAGFMVTSMVYLSVFFLTFLSANIYRYFVQKHKADENDLALVIFNPLFYFLAGYAAMHSVNNDYVGWFAFILAAVYFVIGNNIPDDNKDAKIFHFGVGSTMLFVSIPILLDKQWITIGWAAEAMFLIYYGLVRQWRGLQIIAHILFMVATLRLLVVDFTPFTETRAILNGRALTFFIVVGIISVAAYLTHWFKNRVQEGQPAVIEDKGLEVLLIQAHIAAMFWTAAEIMKFGNDNWVGTVWGLLALIVLSLGLSLKNYDLRVLAYITALFAVFRIILFDTEVDTSMYQPILNMRVVSFLLVAGILGAMAYLISRKKDVLREGENTQMPRIFIMSANLLLIWILSLEINGFFNKQLSSAQSSDKVRSLVNSKRAALSVGWSVYAGLLLAIGIARKSAAARLFSIGLFAIVIFKVFLYDTSNLSNFYRFVSFITLGVILLIAGYFYNRYKDRIEEFIKVNP
jgi:uncharacterized membrane protein